MHIKETGVIVDQRHYSAIAAFSWSKAAKGYYAHYACDPETLKTRYMFSVHRKVWELEYGLPVPEVIDHINRNILDNRVENLRAATASLNSLNRSPRKRKHPLPMGVSKNKDGSYAASITYRGKSIPLGGFSSAEDAGSVVEKNRELLIEHESALVRGECPPEPELIRGERRRKVDWGLVLKMTEEGIPRWQIAETLGVSYGTVAYAQSQVCPKGMKVNTSRRPHRKCPNPKKPRDPDDNIVYCRSWYERLKEDPARWEEFLKKRAEYKRGRRRRGRNKVYSDWPYSEEREALREVFPEQAEEIIRQFTPGGSG